MSDEWGESSKVVRLVFPSDLEFLPLLNTAVEEVLRMVDAGEEMANAVANAVMEAGTNAAQYGRQGSEVEVEFRGQRKTYEAEWRLNGQEVEIRVSEEGKLLSKKIGYEHDDDDD